jgi:GT2 family glycosyltransferase
MFDFTVTFATLNCLDYTKKCIDSLIASGVKTSQIVVVDNASTDGTVDYLKQLSLCSIIENRQNLSCGTAWNQGILANQSEWTIVMNNDILVPPDFAVRLIEFANLHKLKLVSPARIDGELDYNFLQFSEKAQKTTSNGLRMGSSNAVCMCIHWSLFNKIGFFRASPHLLGFEDGIFYNEIRKHNISHATTGSVWIHHFGSVTQDHMKLVLGKRANDVLLKVNDRKIYDQSWLERKIFRHKLKRAHLSWRHQELHEFGISLHGTRVNHEFIWL